MGSGDTFEMYAIPKFNLPRLVLLDIDQRVYWEGDPGLEVGIPWRPGMQSYLDEPLRELIERRKLKDLKRWLAAWQEKGGPALASGDLDTALPYLKKSLELPGRVVPMVGDAQRWLRALENALEHVDVTAEILDERGAVAAIPVLADWARKLDLPIDRTTMGKLRRFYADEAFRDWSKAEKAVKAASKGWKPGKEEAALDKLREALRPLSGEFAEGLRSELDGAAAAGDLAFAKLLIDEAERRPAIWLVYHFAGG